MLGNYDLRRQFNEDLKDLLREFNRHPIRLLVETFEKRGLLKQYMALYPWKSLLLQHILRGLKEGRKRFLINIESAFKGNPDRVWVVRSSATNAEMGRAHREKLTDIEEQLLLFNEMSIERERRTGRAMPKFDLSIVHEMRHQLDQGSGIGTLETSPHKRLSRQKRPAPKRLPPTTDSTDNVTPPVVP